MKLLKKITLKTVYGKTMDASWLFGDSSKEGDERTVLTVVGRADKMERGKSTLPSGDEKDYVRFRGEFAAWAGEMGAGDQFRSSSCILPEVAGDLLAATMDADEVTSANFGFRILVTKLAGGVGFQYSAEPLTQENEADPLAALISQVSTRVPALEGKKAAPGAAKK